MSIDTPSEELTAEPKAEASVVAPIADALVVDELLVEEISIDGMCGVY